MSGELSEATARAYRQHAESCGVCSAELADYRTMKSSYFSPALLGEAPSSTTDREILRVCSQKLRATMGMSLFSGVWRKTAVSAAFLLAGFVGTGYYVYVMKGVGHDTQQMIAQQPVNVAPSVGTQVASSIVKDTTKADSAAQTDNRPYSQKVGTVGVPVSVGKE
jgi:anti-sigma factor RsiW